MIEILVKCLEYSIHTLGAIGGFVQHESCQTQRSPRNPWLPNKLQIDVALPPHDAEKHPNRMLVTLALELNPVPQSPRQFCEARR